MIYNYYIYKKNNNMAQKCPSCDYPYVPNGQEVYCPNCGQKIVQPGCLQYLGTITFILFIIFLIGQCTKNKSNNSSAATNSEITVDTVASQVSEQIYDEPNIVDDTYLEPSSIETDTTVILDTTSSY
jgi:uncharacterized Zn finger protein (UPF0148 family)